MRTALISSWLWALVVMNFIVKLSSSKKFLTKVSYDSILTVVNWFIKKVKFILYRKVSDTEELVYMFLQNVTTLQDLSKKIISYRDKLFILNF